MKIDFPSSFDFHQFVDVKTGTVDRAIFGDEDIYQLELERIFARAWNFMCHESQIPNPGDFFLSYIGEESVICTRDKKGGFQVFLNSCRHRGNAVCRAEQGNTRSFLCTYHGWTYDLEGKLIGVPGYKDLYHEQLDRSQWGLVAAGKVQSYRGFVFANMDRNAVDLEEYLGPVGRIGLELVAGRGEMVMVPGVQKNQIGCNWKLAVDNLFDWYHPDISHASGFNNDYVGKIMPDVMKVQGGPNHHRVLVGDYGHAIGGPKLTDLYFELRAKGERVTGGHPLFDNEWREAPEVKARLGEAGYPSMGHPNIFPNLWITGTQLSLRLPKGPGKCELWWFTMVPSEADAETRTAYVDMANHIFGPAGLLEQDDGENWDQSTRAMHGVIARRHPVNFAMNLGNAPVKRDENGAAYVDVAINEHAQLWTWNAWADWMNAQDWAALTANRSRIPETV